MKKVVICGGGVAGAGLACSLARDLRRALGYGPGERSLKKTLETSSVVKRYVQRLLKSSMKLG